MAIWTGFWSKQQFIISPTSLIYVSSMCWNCTLSQIVCDTNILNLSFISATHTTVCLVKTGIIKFRNKVEETSFFLFNTPCVAYLLNSMTFRILKDLAKEFAISCYWESNCIKNNSVIHNLLSLFRVGDVSSGWISMSLVQDWFQCFCLQMSFCSPLIFIDYFSGSFFFLVTTRANI